MPSRPRAPGSAAEMGAQEIPARGGSPAPPVTTKHDASGTGEAQSGPVRSPAPEGSDRPVEEENSPAEIPWYDKIENIDEDYRLYLSCIRMVNGHQMVVVPEGGLDAKLVPRKKGGEEAASRATSGKNGCGFGKKEEGKGKVAAIATGGPALKSPVGDSATHPQKIQKERKNGWKNGAKKMKVAEKEENPSAEPHLETLSTAWGKGNVEPKLPMETLNTVKRKRKSSDVQNAESRTASKGKDKVPTIITGESAPKSRVRDSTTHPQQGQKEKNGGKNGAKMMKVVEEAEGIALKELPMETLNIVKRKRKSSDVQNADSHTASTDNRKPQLRRSARLMLSPPENDHK
ncbi:hypothetical protein CFC21_018231 [Triticum aestivum]|uniref:Uncharacterized protein n=3 Tax=Triticum TaxID=4564 RepID=A0A9R1P0Q0_TRITD|nr:uncharacterized protein LOC123185781 [Triticum aestivum]KAF7002800.1 hypothetical protein CFC21_018231 [Triticum aestivum]VAH34729.1 unnamed protein product [Triticum turgidum subsp. durum]